MSSSRVSCQALVCRAVVHLLAKNETAQITGSANLSSFIFCVKQLKILKKCRAIACLAITIRAVDMLPHKQCKTFQILVLQAEILNTNL
jgi:hypothetical protein